MGIDMMSAEPIVITLNNKLLEIEAGTTISGLLALRGFPKSVAVFVNKKALLMKEYPVHMLNEADIVVVFRPLSGG